MKKGCWVFITITIFVTRFYVGDAYGWANIHWGSKDSVDTGTSNAHSRWYGGTVCKKFESEFYRYYATTVGTKPLGGYYYYSTHDYILDLALYYLDMWDDSVLNYSVLPCITSHSELDDTLYYTQLPDYMFGDFVNHVELVHKGDYLSGDYRGYPDSTPYPESYAVETITARIQSFIQNCRLSRFNEARLDLGILSHYFADLHQPMHTENLRVYNKNSVIPSSRGPKGDQPPVGTAGVPQEWWKWAPSIPETIYPKTIHSNYETATSYSLIMDGVDSLASPAYSPFLPGTPGPQGELDYTTFLHDEVIWSNSWGFAPTAIDYTYAVNISEDIYDSAMDGYETTKTVGIRYGMLLHTYFDQLVKGDFVVGSDGYTSYGYKATDTSDRVFIITAQNILRAAEKLADLLYGALNEINSGAKTYNTFPGVTINSVNVTPYSVWNQHELLEFQGNSMDLEDGVLSGNSLVWTDSEDGVIDLGINLDIKNFSPGDHHLTVKAFDNNGLKSMWGIDFEITEPGIQLYQVLPDPMGKDNAPAPGGEYIVLYNNGPTDVDVGTPSWNIVDKMGNYLTINQFGAPGEGTTNGVPTIIPPGNYLTVYRNGNPRFTLNNSGDMVTIYSDWNTGARSDREIYGPVAPDEIVTFPVGSVSTNSTPVVSISNPPDEYVTTTGMIVEFTATASDTEDGSMDSSINWVSSLQGFLGTGNYLPISTLTPGIHTITAFVEDSGHHVSNHKITVFVMDKPPATIPTVSLQGILLILSLISCIILLSGVKHIY